jgi:hypothetical protein
MYMYTLQHPYPNIVLFKLKMNNFGKKRIKIISHYDQQQHQQFHTNTAEANNNTIASLSPMSTDDSINTHSNNNNHCTLVHDSPSSLFARANNAVRLSQLETDNHMIQNELAKLNMRLDTLEVKFIMANERIWATLQQILQRLNSDGNNKEQEDKTLSSHNTGEN